MIIVYNDDKKELKDLSHEQLIKRLYVVEGLERDGTRIVLIRHNVCEVTGNGETIDYANLAKKIRCTANKVKWITYGKDFEIKGNDIELKF